MIWSKTLWEEPRWRNWQTRRSQKPMSARTSGFDSRSRHHAGVTAAAAQWTRWPASPTFMFASFRLSGMGTDSDLCREAKGRALTTLRDRDRQCQVRKACALVGLVPDHPRSSPGGWVVRGSHLLGTGL